MSSAAIGSAIGSAIGGQAINGIIGGAFGLGATALNNRYAKEREAIARKENYQYGEMAADNADARTRALYNDFSSPAAMMKQFREAGLSPSLMAAQAAGGNVTSGAQGGGAAGVNPTTFGIDPLTLSEIIKNSAETEKIKADTINVAEDTKGKEIENQIKTIDFEKLNISQQALTSIIHINGKNQSLYEFAGECSSYENFIHRIRVGNHIDTMTLNSEIGQTTLREIWKARNQFSRDIAVLSEEEINAQFQESLINTLKSKDFIEHNAENAVQMLKTNIATNKLTESQQNAWNDLLDALEKRNPMLKDIAIILAIIVDKFAKNSSVNMDFSTKNTASVKL